MHSTADGVPACADPRDKWLREIVGLVHWDKDGATGPVRQGMSWESIGRLALDYAKAAIEDAGADGVPLAAKAPQSWTNERCRHHQCDEADQHDQKCSDWKNEQQRRRRESAAFDAWWVSSGHAADPHYNLTIENCARAAWHARARGVKEDGNG